jgi:uncharacterized protein (TIGR03435 family)
MSSCPVYNTGIANPIARVLLMSPVPNASAFLCLFTMALLGQPPAGNVPALKFDVAAIRPMPRLLVTPGVASGPFHLGIQRRELSHGRFICDYCSLETLITYAYNVRKECISARTLLSDEHFQVDARMPPETPEADVRAMLRSLLAERFDLKSHGEQRSVNAYSLIAIPSKLRIRRVDTETKLFVDKPGEMDYGGITMAELAHQVSARIGSPVVDKTGLVGYYRVRVAWDDPHADRGPVSQLRRIEGPTRTDAQGRENGE